MLESMQTLLDLFPEPVVQVQNGTVTAVNAAAQRCLPQLLPGEPLPDCLALPQTASSASGTFTCGTAIYSFSSSRSGPERVIFFRPDTHSALTPRQLEGALRQLRSLLGELLAEVGPLTGANDGVLPKAACWEIWNTSRRPAVRTAIPSAALLWIWTTCAGRPFQMPTVY